MTGSKRVHCEGEFHTTLACENTTCISCLIGVIFGWFTERQHFLTLCIGLISFFPWHLKLLLGKNHTRLLENQMSNWFLQKDLGGMLNFPILTYPIYHLLFVAIKIYGHWPLSEPFFNLRFICKLLIVNKQSILSIFTLVLYCILQI